LRRCNTCDSDKPLDEFYNNKSRKDGKYTKCKDCQKSYQRNRYKHDPEVRKQHADYDRKRRTHDPKFVEAVRRRSRKFYGSVKGRAKTLFSAACRRDPDATITLEFVENRIAEGFCEVTKIPFDLSNGYQILTGSKNNPFAPSLDRKNPKVGYTPENVRVVIWQFNWMKGELSDIELKYFCQTILKALEQ